MNKFFSAVEQHFPLRFFLFASAAVLFVSVGTLFAFAADATAPAESPSLTSVIISYGLPLAEALFSVLATWIITQIIRLLNVTDQTKRLQIEAELRHVLHFTVENGLRWAFAKAGVSPSLSPSAEILADALFYTKGNSPEAASKAGDDAINRIIVAKLHDMTNWYGTKPSSIDGNATATSAPAG